MFLHGGFTPKPIESMVQVEKPKPLCGSKNFTLPVLSPQAEASEVQQLPHGHPRSTWRIILVSEWLGSPPFISHEIRPFGRGTTLLGGLMITMVINHLLNGMILQVERIATPHGLPRSIPDVTQDFVRYRKKRRLYVPPIFQLYGYSLCKGFHPTPKIAEHKVQETLHFRYRTKLLVTLEVSSTPIVRASC